MKMQFIVKIDEFLQAVNDKISGWLWVLMAAAIALLLVLVIILLIVIGCKNGKIRRLKKEIQLQNEAAQLWIQTADAEQQEETEKPSLPPTDTAASPQPEQTQEEAPKQEPKPQPSPQSAAQKESQPSPQSATEKPTAPETSSDPAEEQEEKPQRKPSFGFTSSTRGNGIAKYIVKYDRAKNSWVVKKDGSDRVIRRTATKEEALSAARALCKNNDANLVVHKKDGKFQKQ